MGRPDSTSAAASVLAPAIDWLKADSIIKSWIFFTLSETLQCRLVTTNPKTAKAAWHILETILLDNKHTCTIALKGELRVIQLGDRTVDAYFQKIESIVTLLNTLGSPLSNDDMGTHPLMALVIKFSHMASIIAHRDPFPILPRFAPWSPLKRCVTRTTPSNNLYQLT